MLKNKLLSAMGGAPANYIEDVFSTWLYTGNGFYPSGGGQTITNGIDLAGKGGLIWIKARSTDTRHGLYDTARGINKMLGSDSTAPEYTDNAMVSANSNGFTLGAESSGWTRINLNGETYASWTFREQPKFFDVVTYTGNGATYRDITTGFSNCGTIIAKCTSGTGDWWVWHRTFGSDTYLKLNTTSASSSADSPLFGSETGGTFGVAIQGSNSLNTNGATYVAYLFAHNAGGFGLSGNDNVISCGSYTGTGATLDVNLGYEVQFVLIKPTSVAGNWTMMDNMRGMTQVGVDGTARLRPNTSEAESALGGSYGAFPNATGFTVKSNPGVDDYNASGQTYIYIAIRRGPMRTPTTGTSVFSGISRSGTGATVSVTGAGFPPDAIITKVRNLNGAPAFWDKLRGPNRALTSNTTNAEETTTTEISSFNQDGFSAGTSSTFYTNASGGYTYINWQLKRAPSFFDEVCYTGTGSATTQAHNLGVVPELMIVKRRNIGGVWAVYSAATGNSSILQLEDTGAVQTGVTNWNSTTPTASVFSVGTQGSVNASGGSYVAYLFGTCAGVSKVGSYTGTGTLTTINCGFTGGARFVLIKRTDAIAEWYVWDTIRGMISGTDPSLRFNNGSSESNANSVYTIATGFQLLASPAVDVNTNGGTYIFLAIA